MIRNPTPHETIHRIVEYFSLNSTISVLFSSITFQKRVIAWVSHVCINLSFNPSNLETTCCMRLLNCFLNDSREGCKLLLVLLRLSGYPSAFSFETIKKQFSRMGWGNYSRWLCRDTPSIFVSMLHDDEKSHAEKRKGKKKRRMHGWKLFFLLFLWFVTIYCTPDLGYLWFGVLPFYFEQSVWRWTIILGE